MDIADAGLRKSRHLRVFAFDPTTAKSYANRNIRHVTIALPWDLDPNLSIGPQGEYVEVIDYDPAGDVFYRPIDLSAPELRASDGLAPSEENPLFHQQMVYAVTMQTIATFEAALGRKVLWSPIEFQDDRGEWRRQFVQRLRIYPHALREANAYYSPVKKALLFGAFEAPENSQAAVPGTTVFTCLSHDIIVHEATHAILDGLHPRFGENSHPDMRALHEAFADIVAIFQLFSFPEVLRDQIADTRGNLENQSMLGALAQEFGRSIGRSNALRNALGRKVDGEWKALEPDKTALVAAKGPHARGSILVAAVFRAFINIYTGQTRDLFRIASSGSGILRQGEIDPDLTNRLAREAASAARRVLRICIRAMDYVPPVSVSFGDYLRAMITADHDLYPDDEAGYRIAILEAFTAWGIRPEGVSVISEGTMLWPTYADILSDAEGTGINTQKGRDAVERIETGLAGAFERPEQMVKIFKADPALKGKGVSQALLARLFRDIDEDFENVRRLFYERAGKFKGGDAPGSAADGHRMFVLGRSNDREAEFYLRHVYARVIWFLVNQEFGNDLARFLGLCLDSSAPASIRRSKLMDSPSLHVMPVRRAERLGGKGSLDDELVVEMIQTRYGYFDRDVQERVDSGQTPVEEVEHDFLYRAGCTIIVNAETYKPRRLIRTAHTIDSEMGLARLRAHLSGGGDDPLHAFYDSSDTGGDTAIADLHRLTPSVEEVDHG